MKLFIQLAAIGIICAGCATTTKIPINVMHPAEINMSAYKQIAMGDFSGSRGQDLADELKENLVNGGAFKIVDRSQLNQILSELKLSQSDLTDSSSSRAKIGKLLSGTALLTGRGIEVKYSDEMTYQDRTCTRIINKNKSEQYACRQYTHVCSASNSGSVDVVDVQTGQVLKSRRLKGGCSDTTQATDARPACMRGQDESERCAISNEIGSFLKAISPWTERREVAFAKDSAIPMLEEGIRTAQMGDLKEAAKTFRSAAKSAETNSQIKPASIAKAYWNLGLALEYDLQYEQALAALKKAYTLKPNPDYLNEQQSVQQLKKNVQELKNQGVVN